MLSHARTIILPIKHTLNILKSPQNTRRVGSCLIHMRMLSHPHKHTHAH